MKLCMLCNANHYAKGLCRNHYLKERYDKNPEKQRLRLKAYRQRLKAKELQGEYQVKRRRPSKPSTADDDLCLWHDDLIYC